MADILSQLQGIKVQLAEYSSTSLDPTSRRHALALVKGIAVDLEDPGDLVDRIVYQVRLLVVESAKIYSRTDRAVASRKCFSSHRGRCWLIRNFDG